METLIDSLLAEQRDLTAVERFSRRHDDGTAGPADRYRHLIPLSAPRPGEQYGFEVDLDRCSGCKACVTACHALNGLDPGESWRSVGLVVGSQPGRAEPLQVTVTTACHHCLEPACLLGCPVLAYDKDPATGIVRHLDDQCIGCSYCILKCPYEVPRYSARRGIVRKCDLCHGRLADGEAPACVQACPNEAIRIGTVPSAWQPIALHPSGPAPSPPDAVWWTDAPDPAITRPTTRYRTRRDPADWEAADADTVRPAAPHWPLILMLVLTQAGSGGMIGGVLAGGPGADPATIVAAVVACALVHAGLLASVLHLGQPAKAWRVWMGWRTSWLSREALILPGAAATASLLTLVLLRPDLLPPRAVSVLPVLHVVATLMAVAAQTLVYVDTRRPAWRAAATGPRFLGTVTLAAAAVAVALHPTPAGAATLLAVVGFRLVHEQVTGRASDGDGPGDRARRRTAHLLAGTLGPRVRARRLAAAAGALLLVGVEHPVAAGAGLVLLLLGEILERHLFFTAMVPDRMPGLP